MKRYCLLERMLHRYHDGSLDRGGRSRFEHHLPGCVRCSRRLHALEETDSLLSRTRPQPPELAPAAQDLLFRTALAAAQAGVRPSPWQRRWRLATCFALLVGVFGGLAWQQQSTAHGVVTARVEPERSIHKQVADVKPVVVAMVEPPQVIEPQTIQPRRSVRRHFGRRRSAHALRRHGDPAPVAAVASVDAPEVEALTLDEPIREAPSLLVIATREADSSMLNVTVSTSDEPGYATAAYTTITPFGTQVVTQATISSCTPDHPGTGSDETTTPDQTPTNEQEREDRDGMD